MSVETVRELYRKSDQKVRGSFSHSIDEASDFFRRYLAFAMTHVQKPGSRILDIGCGSGWSTVGFREAGHRAFGIDLHSSPEARNSCKSLPFVCADALVLPFRDSSIDFVGMYQVLEHVPEPEQALYEAFRVLRSNGRLVVVGPNLLSVGVSVKSACIETWKALKSYGKWTKRDAHTPRHPFGNTLPEVYQHLCHHALHTAKKLAGERPTVFLMRRPDTTPPFHADNDACYFCNPMDLLLWANQTGIARAVRWWGDGSRIRRLLWPFWGGCWVVLEKL